MGNSQPLVEVVDHSSKTRPLVAGNINKLLIWIMSTIKTLLVPLFREMKLLEYIISFNLDIFKLLKQRFRF